MKNQAKQTNKKTSGELSQGHIEDVSRSEFEKRRGYSPGNDFVFFYVNQPVARYQVYWWWVGPSTATATCCGCLGTSLLLVACGEGGAFLHRLQDSLLRIFYA